MTEPRITGTFIDEITHDIPSQNWGREDWRREFELYSKIGIDTLVIIRAGYRNKCIFGARSIPNLLPVYEDLGKLFFDAASDFGLKIFFGLYDSGNHWMRGDWQTEVDLNKKFIEEAAERYGASPAFCGWYICHETSRNELNIIDLFNELGRHCKKTKDVPVLISPFPQGSKQFAAKDVLSLEPSVAEWDQIFGKTRGAFDICAFQDGQIEYEELPEFQKAMAELCRKHGVTSWANVESFDRDMPIKFPPADFRYLRYKLETGAKHVEKLITFEFPHFMSPHSTWLSGRNHFRRYCEYVKLDPVKLLGTRL
jgi:hypothetical protein